MDAFSGVSNLFLFRSVKGVYSIRKEFAPKGSKFFPYRVDPFSEGVLCGGKQTKISKYYSSLRSVEST